MYFERERKLWWVKRLYASNPAWLGRTKVATWLPQGSFLCCLPPPIKRWKGEERHKFFAPQLQITEVYLLWYCDEYTVSSKIVHHVWWWKRKTFTMESSGWLWLTDSKQGIKSKIPEDRNFTIDKSCWNKIVFAYLQLHRSTTWIIGIQEVLYKLRKVSKWHSCQLSLIRVASLTRNGFMHSTPVCSNSHQDNNTQACVTQHSIIPDVGLSGKPTKS